MQHRPRGVPAMRRPEARPGAKAARGGLFILLATLLSPQVMALEARVEGVEGALADNIRYYLAPLEIPADSDTEGYAAEVQERARNALRPFGYYDPDFTLAFEGRERVRLAVEPGEPVIVESVDVRILGAGERDEAFAEALEASELEAMAGETLLHAPYETLKTRLSALALERGYFDARYRQSRIEVHPWAHRAYITLVFQSGERYRFGDIFIDGSQIREQRLRNMAPFAPGDRYLATEVARYSRRLGESGWFRSVGVQPRIDQSGYASGERESPGTVRDAGVTSSPDARVVQPDGSDEPPHFIDALALDAPAANDRVPIRVDVVPADRHQFEVGLGYATDVGPRTSFNWTVPWRNERGDSLENELYISAPEQTLTGEYSLPLDNPVRDSYYLRYGIENVDRRDTDTRSLKLALEGGRRWRFENDWIQNVYLRSTFEDFTQGGEEGSVLLFVPGMTWSRTRTDDTRFPLWGDRQDILLEGASEVWGSDTDFLRTRLDTQWIRSAGTRNRFLGRVTVGATATSDFRQVPPSLRFFTGGDSSVRGYEYETISPENADGEKLGGRHLLVGALEYQRRLTGQWWGATFFDAGNAFNEWWPAKLEKSAGLGVRWITPVGPVRLDIAHPFDHEEDAWRLHFGIGPEF